MTGKCPACSGRNIDSHPAGILAWHHGNKCILRRSEDSQKIADRDALDWRGATERPATDTERVLLAALGATMPAQLETTITTITGSILARTWPGLKQITPTPTGDSAA